MSEEVKELAAKSNGPGSIPRTQIVTGENSQKLFPDLYSCLTVWAHGIMYMCMHAHQIDVNKKRGKLFYVK